MQPKFVLLTEDLAKARENRDCLIAHYQSIAIAHPELAGQCQGLMSRAERAYELLSERLDPPAGASVSWQINDYLSDQDNARRFSENAELDGDFPLGNEADAALAACHLSLEEIARLQCGLGEASDAGRAAEQAKPTATRCISHPDAMAVDSCECCGRPICAYCRDHNQTYSVAAEAGVPYCVACYDRTIRFYTYQKEHGLR